MNKFLAAAGAASVLLLAGCATTPPTLTTTTGESATTVTQPAAITPADIAAKLGCIGYAPLATARFTTAYGDCSLNGHRVQIYTFASSDLQQAFMAYWAPYGVTAAKVIQGDGWTVAPSNLDALPAILDALS
jgi:hypothetical protein